MSDLRIYRSVSCLWPAAAQCGGCGSRERHRTLFRPCIANGGLDDCGTLWHFAPESVLLKLLKERAARYISVDLAMPDVDLNLNIEKTDLDSNDIDVAICNHILEHVDIRKALGVLFGILKPDFLYRRSRLSGKKPFNTD